MFKLILYNYLQIHVNVYIKWFYIIKKICKYVSIKIKSKMSSILCNVVYFNV